MENQSQTGNKKGVQYNFGRTAKVEYPNVVKPTYCNMQKKSIPIEDDLTVKG